MDITRQEAHQRPDLSERGMRKIFCGNAWRESGIAALSDQEADGVALLRLSTKESLTVKLFSAISYGASKYKIQDLTLVLKG